MRQIQMSKKNILIPLIVGAIVFLSISCAQVGAPVGGRKDTIAPVMVGSFPAYRSTGFRGKRLELTFDEYFTIKDQSKALLVSPPLSSTPEILVKGKTIQITLDKPLDENKTYSFSFGNSVRDLNEGNPIKNFQFVVSTGSSVDSLCISGQVLGASDLKPVKEVYVMLYEQMSDSVPRKTLPAFIGKTDEKGFFSIQNVALKKYRIFALKDLNANYRYDMPTEEIAFNDSLYFPESYRKLVNDTLKIPVPNDTIFRDSIVARMRTLFRPDNVKLFMFQEDNQKQYVKTYERSLKGRLSFIFNKGQLGDVALTPLNFKPKDSWFVKDRSIQSDSLTYWITDPELVKTDTLKLAVNYMAIDSLKKTYQKRDTLKFVYQPQKKDDKGKDEKAQFGNLKDKTDKDKKKIESVVDNIMISGGSVLDLYKHPVLALKEPIRSIDFKQIHLWEVEDKTKKDVEFKLEIDSLKNTLYSISAKWISQSKYTLYIEKGAIVGLSGMTSDSTTTSFQVQKEDVYGVVNYKMVDFPSSAIVECLTKDDKLVTNTFVERNGIASFKTLKPGKYKFRAVVDLNRNKRWDVGDFSKNRQAEQVIPFGKIIEVKANWTNDLDWDYKKKQ